MLEIVAVSLTPAQLMQALRIARKIVEGGNTDHIQAISYVGEMVRRNEAIPAAVWDETVEQMHSEQFDLIEAAESELDEAQVVTFNRQIARGVYVFVEAR